MSPAFDRILGYSAGAIPARDLPPTSCIPTTWPRMQADSGEITGAQAMGGTELRLRHADGTWRWFEAKITNHLDNPKVRGIVGNLHDITERKQTEEALREAHERFLSAFENAPIGMAMVDLDGRVLRANSALGQDRRVRHGRRLCGMNVHDFTHPEDRESSRAEMARLVSASRCRRRTGSRSATSTPTVTRCGCRSTSRACATTRDGLCT